MLITMSLTCLAIAYNHVPHMLSRSLHHVPHMFSHVHAMQYMRPLFQAIPKL